MLSISFDVSPSWTVLFSITLQILRSFAVVLFDSQHPMELAPGAPIQVYRTWDEILDVN